MVTNSLPTYKWVQRLGGKFSDTLTAPVGAMWTRGHNPVDKKGIFDVLSNYVVNTVNNGSEIMMETKAEKLIVENGKAVGVKASKTDGTEVVLHAKKGVILATGGFGANPQLCAEYNTYWPSIPDDIKTTNASTSTGDGIIMSKEIGANLVGMGFTQLMPTANEKTGSLTDALLVAPQNYIFVNKEGKRFVNEYAERDVLSWAALSQPDGVFYTIADKDMALSAQNRPTQEMIDKMVEDKLIYRADTLEGLADIIGCDRATFVNKINKYNSYVKSGTDPEFNKNVFQMEVKNAPFYACPAKPAIHHTMGGVQINTNGQVIDAKGNVIQGLYAAGEVTGGIHAGNRLGGNAIADIFVFGRIAGKNAALNK
ncbi:urocanate reductase precursor [Oxobacter pfennigii]|uniref:Urocanate reductase n=1 Tax=Oxobacter pfennigii TaxID=36849 RepID=A0A0P8W3H0_9CLOT|nr:flavocytochrome c [Oxobacter pfennigii]KPU43138.1 urocanate reductase precursor [Oxobacter pfennigii]